MSENPIMKRIERELYRRKAGGLLRATPREMPTDLLDMSTNSYLSLHKNVEINSEAMELCGGNLAGNTASRLVATTSSLYDDLEAELASLKHSESALVWSSGYAANVGIITALAGRHTAVFCDRLNHASIYDGIAMSGAILIRYAHCDMNDLAEKLLASNASEKIIVTDAVFSMDGDRAPLLDICDCAERFGAMVMVDEAHSTGIFGATGAGLCEEDGVCSRVAVRMGTLSKAIGSVGGFVACSEKLRTYFVNYSRSFVYSTGLPPASLAFALASVRYIRAHADAGKNLS